MDDTTMHRIFEFEIIGMGPSDMAMAAAAWLPAGHGGCTRD
jgi:hypothetical protein